MTNKEQIKNWIIDYVEKYPQRHDIETRWREPVIGFASAADPLYAELKKTISPTHAMPQDIVPGAKTVIVYFVPFADSIIKSNIPGEESSREWDYAYIETNTMLASLSHYLYEKILAAGYRVSDMPPTYNYDPVALRSDWSHRSSAVIAGIGKFGINNMLITKQGCCGRLSSTITDWEIQPDTRTEEEYCLYKINGSCGLCMTHCPICAFSKEGSEIFYDRNKCNYQIYEKTIPQWPIGPGDTCGKCMVGLPCSSRIPLCSD